MPSNFRQRIVKALSRVMLLWSAGDIAMAEDAFTVARERMVSEQIVERGIVDARVIDAMRRVPRHRFVPPTEAAHAYRDTPLPIGEGQTISQPYIVALMTELAEPQPHHRVLEIGTGSGYQAAILAELVQHVYSIELEPSLASSAQSTLRELGYTNVTVRAGDGYAGWPEHAPFDIVIVTAAPDHVPQPLVEQLKAGGRMIVPVGEVFGVQELRILEKDSAGTLRTRDVAAVRFVPLRRPEAERVPR